MPDGKQVVTIDSALDIVLMHISRASSRGLDVYYDLAEIIGARYKSNRLFNDHIEGEIDRILDLEIR